MIIKKADDKKSQIEILQSVGARHDASPDVRKRIEQETRQMRAGMKAEAEAAYEIDFHFGAAKNYAVIHDLRIESEGRVAQIDHLVIGRFLDIWVCETKNFCEGIAINEQGECSRFYNNKPYGMPSPFEQNRKHIMVLASLFKTGLVQLPTRLGFVIKPNMSSVVLVSKNARISRPKEKVVGVEGIVKIDQFRSLIERSNGSDNNPLTMAKLIGSDTLEHLAHAIAAQHKPIAFNWTGKFGLPETPPGEPTGVTISQALPPRRSTWAAPSPVSESLEPSAAEERKPKKKLICSTCSEPVAFNVARFCWLNKRRFGENIHCRECQKTL